MTVAIDASFLSRSMHVNAPAVCLEDKFEIIKDIGDGSFGSVVLARTRSAGAHLVRRNTLVAIKTMKKTFESFAQCLELREVIFLRSLPNHPHLVSTYDIFLDPISKKLHIAMESMDGNLYQLMKTRDHKPFEASTVKSIMFQILSGLEHIHEHHFFHRDIKPENILVSSMSSDIPSAFKRYSSLVAPPSAPATFSVKLADFGLARETESMVPYTTYVSTRWYRAPEVLLRAGHYSAPVDIWALGAMAVEIATLKPLFPGGNEVDQVWRVCEIMGSPGSWMDKQGHKLGGGDWKEGIRLASKLGFSFPKMAPHSMDSILQPPHWPASFANLVTWCLMWDPEARPTSTQALQHEYFADAVDPLRPKSSSTARFLGRRSPIIPAVQDSPEITATPRKTSWFKKSSGTPDVVAPLVPEHKELAVPHPAAARPAPVHSNTTDATGLLITRRPVPKRASWTTGPLSNFAPIPILPSIRPISPLPDTVNVQANTPSTDFEEKPSQKIARQLSVNSNGNHYADFHRQEAEKALNGAVEAEIEVASQSVAKEGFFSHLRKRARRFSGRHQAPPSPNADDIEASAGCAPWGNNRSSMVIDQLASEPPQMPLQHSDSGFAELDKVLEGVRDCLDSQTIHLQTKQVQKMPSNPALKRHHSLYTPADGQAVSTTTTTAHITARTAQLVRRIISNRPRYETPDEEEELLDEVIANAHRAVLHLDDSAQSTTQVPFAEGKRPSITHVASDPEYRGAYLTPSPSKDRLRDNFGLVDLSSSKPIDIAPRPAYKDTLHGQWPTPPYEDSEWAASAAASIFAAQAEAAFR